MGNYCEQQIKKSTIFFLLLLPISSFGQYKYLFLKENFFDRQQNARAEAMGKSYTSIEGDLTSVYFNPAGTATIKGIEINGSFTPPKIYLTEGYYSYFSAGCNLSLNKIFNKVTRKPLSTGGDPSLNIAFSQFHFDYGKTENLFVSITPYSERNTLTISSEPIKNLLIGLNANYLVWQPGFVNKAATSHYFDFGIIKKIQFLLKQNSGHSANIGASISNHNNSRITLDYKGAKSINELPVVTRYGANYQFSFDKQLLIDTLKTLIFLVQGEYQKLLNSEYETAIRGGGEVMLFEILSLRAGYYMEKQDDFGYPSINYGKISSLTYGFGLQAPLHKLTKMPINIQFDYTSLPQPKYYNNSPDWENFTTYNLRLNWILKNK